MPLSAETLLEYHRKHAWQPFTQMKLAPDPVFIERGEGVYLHTRDGRKLIDGVGSWWVNVHGHAHPYINAKLREQSERLEHVIYAGLAHEPATVLAERLSAATGHALPRVFYSDNGSTAVEIGLKMAFQYFANGIKSKSSAKSEFIALGDGYHGDTLGAMSVGARGVFHKMFEPLLFPVHHVPAPKIAFADFDDASAVDTGLAPVIDRLEQLLNGRADRICALILEPLVQGASAGFNMYPPALLKTVRELCDRHEVFLIADEVFTGCGRTGTFFACEHANIQPDILCISKALSGGYLPFAVTMATEQVFAGFYSDDRRHTLFHGHSMTANPLGCATALASLDLIEGVLPADASGKVQVQDIYENDLTFSRSDLMQVRELERRHAGHQERLISGPAGRFLKEVRCLGSVGAVELEADERYISEFSWKLMSTAVSKGALLRPLGNVVYLTPAYNIGDAELGRLYEVLQDCLTELLG